MLHLYQNSIRKSSGVNNFFKDFLRTTDKGYISFSDARASSQKCCRKIKSKILQKGLARLSITASSEAKKTARFK